MTITDNINEIDFECECGRWIFASDLPAECLDCGRRVTSITLNVEPPADAHQRGDSIPSPSERNDL